MNTFNVWLIVVSLIFILYYKRFLQFVGPCNLNASIRNQPTLIFSAAIYTLVAVAARSKLMWRPYAFMNSCHLNCSFFSALFVRLAVCLSVSYTFFFLHLRLFQFHNANFCRSWHISSLEEYVSMFLISKKNRFRLVVILAKEPGYL